MKRIITGISLAFSLTACAFTVATNSFGVVILRAEDGKAVCRSTENGPTLIRSVALARTDSPANWKDCTYGDVKKYSVRAVIGELKKEGKWSAVRAMLVQADYLDMFLASNYLSSVDPDFRSACAALVEHGVMTRAELDAMLARCLWSPE